MTRRLAQLALYLYPLAFRRRYGDEMRALLDQSPTRAMTVLDLVRGALVAHLRPRGDLAELVAPADRVRASASGVLFCWVLLSIAGFGFYKSTEDAPFGAAGHAHPLLRAAHLAIQGVALVGSGAVVLGALPLIVVALAEARRRPALRRLVSLPPLAVLVFAALTGVLVVVANSNRPGSPSTVGGAVFVAWGAIGVACAAVCVIAARAALFAVPLSRPKLLTAYACAATVTVAMAVIALATLLYAIALPADAPRLADLYDGPFQIVTTTISLAAQVVVMAIAVALASTTTRRGWRAAGALRAS